MKSVLDSLWGVQFVYSYLTPGESLDLEVNYPEDLRCVVEQAFADWMGWGFNGK